MCDQTEYIKCGVKNSGSTFKLIEPNAFLKHADWTRSLAEVAMFRVVKRRMYEIPNLSNGTAIIQEIPTLKFQKRRRGKMESKKESGGEWMAYKDRFVAHNVRGEEGLKKRSAWMFR